MFATVRRDVRSREPVGSMGEIGGRPVMFDDNRSPTVAFTWAAGHAAGKDVQYNHIWPASREPSAYTALWNICMTPGSSQRQPMAETTPMWSARCGAGRSICTVACPTESRNPSRRLGTTSFFGPTTRSPSTISSVCTERR